MNCFLSNLFLHNYNNLPIFWSMCDCVWDVYLINRWKFKEVHIATKFGISFQRSTVRKNCSSDREKLLKFKAEGREFQKFFSILEYFFSQHSQNNFWNKIPHFVTICTSLNFHLLIRYTSQTHIDQKFAKLSH